MLVWPVWLQNLKTKWHRKPNIGADIFWLTVTSVPVFLFCKLKVKVGVKVVQIQVDSCIMCRPVFLV